MGGAPCRFRTCYDTTLWPVSVAAAQWTTPERLRPAVRAPDAVAALRLELKCFADVRFDQLSLDALRMHLAGDASLVYPLYELLLNNQGGYSGTALVLSGDLVRAAGVRLACKVVGMVVGVGVAVWLDIDFVRLWTPPAPIPHAPWEWAKGLPTLVASGVAIGLGAGPVHKIITAIERRQAARSAPPAKDQQQ